MDSAIKVAKLRALRAPLPHANLLAMYDLRTAIARTENLAEAMFHNQETDAGAPGRYVPPDGVASGSHGDNAKLLAALARLYFEPDSRFYGDAAILARIDRALDFQRSLVEETGLIDLVSTNWQSPPDTAFTMQLLAPLLEVVERAPGGGSVSAARSGGAIPGASAIRDGLIAYLERTARAVVGAGFHTPNHRWVVCSALALARTYVPELDVTSYIDAILAEGIDINEDGEYSERSTGTYAAVSNRSLILMAEHLDRPELLEPVRTNLAFMSRLFHADGSVVTAMSQRQDRGTHVVPVQMADVYKVMAHLDGNDEWHAIADMLVDAAAPATAASKTEDPAWLLYPFHHFPELRSVPTPAREVPDRYEKHFAHSGLHRIRDGELSCTVIRNDHAMLDLVWGPLHVSSVKLAGTYFGAMRFEAASMEATTNGVRLRMPAEAQTPVGYYLPLGRRVPFEEALETKGQRAWVVHEPFALEVEIVRSASGLRLHLRGAGGRAGVPFQLELCVHGATEWVVPNAAVTALPGASTILKDGHGSARCGRYALRVGPGSRAHRMWQMRGSEAGCTGFRIVVPLLSPLEKTIEISHGWWHEPEDRFVPAGVHY